MSLVAPNGGEAILLDAATGKTPATAWTLRLFTVLSPVLANSTVVAHLTEAVGGGYAAIPLVAANWVTTPGSPTATVYPLQSFTFTGPLTTNPNILGYYITRADGALVYVELLATPFVPTNNGDILDVTAVLRFGSVSND